MERGCSTRMSNDHDIRHAGALKVSYVDTLGSAYPHPPGQRLMNVAEQGSPRTVAVDHREQVLRADLGSPSPDVVKQFGNSWRDVAAQHVHTPERCDSRRILLRRAQVRPEDRLALRDDPARQQPTADKSPPQAADISALTVQDMDARMREMWPQLREVHIARGSVGRSRESRKKPFILL